MARRRRHGGARRGAGRKPYPAFRPSHSVIDVRNGHAVVSRWQRDGAAFQLESASNWHSLEEDAMREVEALGGSILISGIYAISEALAVRAQWDDE